MKGSKIKEKWIKGKNLKKFKMKNQDKTDNQLNKNMMKNKDKLLIKRKIKINLNNRRMTINKLIENKKMKIIRITMKNKKNKKNKINQIKIRKWNRKRPRTKMGNSLKNKICTITTFLNLCRTTNHLIGRKARKSNRHITKQKMKLKKWKSLIVFYFNEIRAEL